MSKTLIEELDKLGDRIIAKRKRTVARAKRTLGDLTQETEKFYAELWKRYGGILKNTREIHNACTQYTVDYGHGKLCVGLAQTGRFSSIAGWHAYSFDSFYLWTRNDKGNVDNECPERLNALRDFLENVSWNEIDKQIATQYKQYLHEYDDDTRSRDNF